MMTELEWMTCTNPDWTLHLPHLRAQYTDRKFRLFACACCRRVWNSLRDSRSRKAVHVAEKFCDGLAAANELEQAHYEATKAAFDLDEANRLSAQASPELAHAHAPIFATFLVCGSHAAAFTPALTYNSKVESITKRISQCELIKEIFGNPFRPISTDPRWLTPAIRERVRNIYDERRFDLMPELASMLENQGCDNADILDHCRRRADHVRGCWVLDLILGRR
jgi:hypothetical protein